MTRRSFGAHTLETSNEDKVLFPDDGITKGDLIEYYERIADHILPWLEERPLVLRRFPDGIDAKGFFQKQVAEHFPDWVTTTRVKKVSGGVQELTVCDSKATLAYLANLACITPHPWLSRTDRLDHPDQLVIDLDPPGGDFEPVRRAARACKKLLDELELPSFAKTTGSRGVHVMLPLDRSADFDEARVFAQEMMGALAERHPDELTTEVRKNKRKGRLFLDVARNAYAQTAVAAYAVRARPRAPISTPIDWDELGKVDARRFTIKNIFRRLGQRDDPWKGMSRHATSIGQARKRLESLRAE